MDPNSENSTAVPPVPSKTQIPDPSTGLKNLIGSFSAERLKNDKKMKTLVILIAVLFTLLVVGIIFNAIAKQRDASKPPDPSTIESPIKEKYLYTMDEYLEMLKKDVSNVKVLKLSYDPAVSWTRIKFPDIPSVVSEFINLEEVYFSGHGISQFPQALRPLSGLKVIELSKNNISSLPSDISTYANLEVLDLSNNQITELPASIGSLTNLKVLRVNGNLLKTLPPTIGKLTKLETLDLGSNQIESLPPEILNLTNLRRITVDHNNSKVVNSDMILNQIYKLKSLIYLDFSYNGIETLPEAVGDLQNLQTLILDHNYLTSLPLGITKLPNLEKLVVGANQLTAVPVEFGSMPKLKEIHLWENNIEDRDQRDILKIFAPTVNIYFKGPIEDPKSGTRR
jgi:Leucine-rich repeat (LRR) protein